MAVEAYTTKDTSRPLKFETEVNIDGDEIFATAYAKDSTDTYDLTETPTSSFGTSDVEQVVIADFSQVPAGIYTIVIYTSDQVVSKDILIVYNEDGFTID